MNLDDVKPGRRADVAIDDLTAARAKWERENRRPRALSAREALEALEFEALVVMVAAGTLANGDVLTADDRRRLHLAWRRIDTIVQEATR